MRDTPGFQRVAKGVGLFTAALWLIHVLLETLVLPQSLFGVRPGEPAGLIGVLTAPLVHGSFRHLVANTAPLLFLGTLMLYGFPRAASRALPLIWLGSGLGVWLFGRDSAHIGISGVNLGMLVFVFVAGVLRRDRRSIAMALAVAFLYGGMIWGVLPLEERISFESHLAGALCGLLAAVLFQRADPVPRRRYSWEQEPEMEEFDPVIGDLWRHASGPEEPLPGNGGAPATVQSRVIASPQVMQAGAPGPAMTPGGRRALRVLLERCAARGQTLTVRQAAQALGLDSPAGLQVLDAALREETARDADAGRALRAAVVVGAGDLPPAGFFRQARSLGRYAGPDDGPPAQDFHARELAALRSELAGG